MSLHIPIASFLLLIPTALSPCHVPFGGILFIMSVRTPCCPDYSIYLLSPDKGVLEPPRPLTSLLASGTSKSNSVTYMDSLSKARVT